MSVYNLENQTSFNHYVKNRVKFLHLSDKEYVNKYFLIGEKVNKKEQMFSQVMLELLCTENCELINYINDKLEGKSEVKKCKPKKNKKDCDDNKSCKNDEECEDLWNQEDW